MKHESQSICFVEEESVCLKEGCLEGYSLECFCPFFLLCVPKDPPSLWWCYHMVDAGKKMSAAAASKQQQWSVTPHVGEGVTTTGMCYSSLGCRHTKKENGVCSMQTGQGLNQRNTVCLSLVVSTSSTPLYPNTRPQLLLFEGIASSPKFGTNQEEEELGRWRWKYHLYCLL